jgi:hypothetical protein
MFLPLKKLPTNQPPKKEHTFCAVFFAPNKNLNNAMKNSEKMSVTFAKK